jgi:hypothetical protein
MKRLAARSESQVDVACRPRDVHVLSWTKIRHFPLTKLEKNGISTTSELTYSLQKNYLAPTANVVADKNKRQRHTKKLILLDLKKGEKTKPLISRIDQHTLPSTLRRRPTVASVRVELKQIYSPRRCSQNPNGAPQQIKPNPNY